VFVGERGGRAFLKLFPTHTHKSAVFVTQVSEDELGGYCGTHERIKPCVEGFCSEPL